MENRKDYALDYGKVIEVTNRKEALLVTIKGMIRVLHWLHGKTFQNAFDNDLKPLMELMQSEIGYMQDDLHNGSPHEELDNGQLVATILVLKEAGLIQDDSEFGR